MSEPTKTPAGSPALHVTPPLSRGIHVVGRCLSDFTEESFTSKKGHPCRIQKGMVSCGGGIVVLVQRFMEVDEPVLALPKEDDPYVGHVGPEREGDVLRLTLVKPVKGK